MANQLYGRKATAKKLGISVRIIDVLITSKELTALKIRNRTLVSETAIAEFIKRKEAEKQQASAG